MVHSRRDTTQGETPTESRPGDDEGAELYFFPDQRVFEARVQSILRDGPREERAWVISHLLRYAQWDDIWSYVTRDEVRDIFPELDLPETLQVAWGRMLRLAEVPVA